MKIKTWHEGMSDKETADLAYWERNMLALRYAEGWYNDDVEADEFVEDRRDEYFMKDEQLHRARFKGWRRVLTLDAGRMTFHIPDDFDVGNLPEVQRNWDGHTTEEKWQGVAIYRGIA